MRWLVSAMAVVLLAGSGCQADRSDRGGRSEEYVALGDSYSSGGGLSRIDPASGECQRSALSYPHLVAEALDARLTDVTCSAAGTASAVAPQVFQDGTSARPQLAAVSAGADLVTVGLGYNDSGFFLDLVFGCAQLAASDPTGAPCRSLAGGQELSALTDPIGESVRKLLVAVQRRAPDATVLLVGYPQLVPATGRCADLPLARGDYGYVREGLELLDQSLRRAAEDAGATYVDVWSASEGHDICAGDDAWVNGATGKPGVAAFYHPFERAQRAIADLVVEAAGQ
jgi:lysophospholipase L1-like esterase